MTHLIRPSSHSNGIQVFYVDSGQYFRKVAVSDIGASFIKNQEKGINWYSNRRSSAPYPYIKNVFYRKDYSRLDLYEIDGYKCAYSARLSKTMKYVAKAIDHYVEMWPDKGHANENVPIHGDLTLDNIIFSNDGPHIIDWEHFDLSGGPWGFDLVYLVLSSFVLPFSQTRIIDKLELGILSDLWNILIRTGVHGQITRDPFEFYRKFFRENDQFRSIAEDSPRKMFPLWISQSLETVILDTICERA